MEDSSENVRKEKALVLGSLEEGGRSIGIQNEVLRVKNAGVFHYFSKDGKSLIKLPSRKDVGLLLRI